MADKPDKPTTNPTILCKHCGMSIRKERLSLSTQWIHNRTFLRACGMGKSSEAEPKERGQ